MSLPCRKYLRFSAMLLASLVVLAFPHLSHAHAPSDTFLTYKLSATNLTGRWQVSARDLQHAIGLDPATVSPQDLRLREEAVALDTFRAIKVTVDASALPLQIIDEETLSRPDGDALVLYFRSDPWTNKPSELKINGQSLLKLDPTIRCILRIEYWNEPVDSILNASRPSLTVNLSQSGSQVAQLLTFIREGIWHIWTGYDHILFLIALLLPSVLHWRDDKWDSAAAFKPVLVNVLKIVTAFTLAHSLTLALASLHIVTLPSRWIESVIAASVAIAAANNLIPLFRERGWLVAFGFGLVHGFGFATVLNQAGLPSGGLAMALIGFNVGVEIGQLAIVSVFIPVAYQFRQTVAYRNVALRAGSVAVMLLAGIWMAERMFDFKVLPF
jgi:hypothetical protein